MKSLKSFNFKNKKALVRCDFNVSLSDKGEILDDFRIKQTLPTIEYLTDKQAKVILISHLGRPQEKKEIKKEKLSLKPIALSLEKHLNKKVKFLNDCLGQKVEHEIDKMQAGEIILLENLRFYKQEEEGDEEFAKKLASLADVYINDAFSASHRAHASITAITKFLPSYAGLLLEKEINILSRVLEKPWRPLIAIIGGVKIETKIKLINQFLKKSDHLLLGSKLVEIILSSKGILVNRFPSSIKEVEKINLTHPGLHLPVDGQMALSTMGEEYSRIGAIGTLKKEEEVYDIGPETTKVFVGIIKSAKMIIWNGSLGMTERKPFDKGSKEIADAILRNHAAYKIVGGGDTIAFLSSLKILDKFDHVSTGGGAMLEFLGGDKLPGIEALK